MWKSIVVLSVAVVVSDRVVVAASVVDDGAIVEDGGEVVVEVKFLFSVAVVVFRQSCGCCISC